jgi:hypothetical protein
MPSSNPSIIRAVSMILGIFLLPIPRRPGSSFQILLPGRSAPGPRSGDRRHVAFQVSRSSCEPLARRLQRGCDFHLRSFKGKGGFACLLQYVQHRRCLGLVARQGRYLEVHCSVGCGKWHILTAVLCSFFPVHSYSSYYLVYDYLELFGSKLLLYIVLFGAVIPVLSRSTRPGRNPLAVGFPPTVHRLTVTTRLSWALRTFVDVVTYNPLTLV